MLEKQQFESSGNLDNSFSSQSVNSLWRTFGVALLLIAGLTAVYGQKISASLLGQPQVANEELTYIVDLDFWQRSKRETQVTAKAHFDLDHQLTDVPLQLGNWVGKEVPETNEEVMILLEPEQYVQRLYQNSDGQYIWLSMIGGRSSQPFHAPDICYDADGWQYDLGSTAIPLDGGGEIHGLWLDAHKRFPGATEDAEHIVFYFYLFPNRARELKDGIVLFKLTSSRYGTVEDTLKMHGEFIRHLFSSAKS